MRHTAVRGHRGAFVGLCTALAMLAAPLTGCGRDERPTDHSSLPPIDESMRQPGGPQSAPMPEPEKKPYFSTTQKVVMLGGAAALYYLYKKNQAKKADGALASGEPQYYLSKNGRVYYRDAQHRVHWVTPPSEGIAVPASEAQQYEQFQGYDNRSYGRDLMGLDEATP